MRTPWLLAFGFWLSACGEDPPAGVTRSLTGSGDVTFLCVKAATNSELLPNYEGRPLESCPDYVASADANGEVTAITDGEGRELVALVTQVETGELALVRLSGCETDGSCDGRVRDLEPTQPGTNFLAVGAKPGSIVSTPGGVASFVGVGEPGKEGIFAIPTSCIGPRQKADSEDKSLPGASLRDITTWPACRLPAPPGEIEILFATEGDRCGRAGKDALTSEQRADRECPADLSLESSPGGRHKLAVAMPSLGKLAIVDAQALLDRAPGSFADCPVDAVVNLKVELPASEPAQEVPPDMSLALAGGGTCDIGGYYYPTAAREATPSPSDLALHKDRLYVADEKAPVVHVLDVTNACNIKELPPLLPTSFLQPGATVTTRRVAVSPVTPSGKQFVYAVDNTANAGAGSAMVFDVSAGATQRTPLVRPRSRYIANEPPDRIAFSEEIADITFARQDLPVVDLETGVAVEGLECDPDPNASPTSPAAQHRAGGAAPEAAPPKLRGVFGFVALHSGLLAVIDVEDLDAPCRRTVLVNPGTEEDFRGCKNDAFTEPLIDASGFPTVSNELSCNIIEPHRVRPASMFHAGSGGSAPRLRAFPQLRDESGASLGVDQTEEGRRRPRLLAASFTTSPGDAEVLVGAAYYSAAAGASNPLVLDPALAERNSVVLPFKEPRAYTGGSAIDTVTYEGVVRGLSEAVFAIRPGLELESIVGLDPQSNYGVLEGATDGRFCDSGIEDLALTEQRGRAQFAAEVPERDLRAFRRQYTDYVNVTGDLFEPEHRYWSDAGKTCGEKSPKETKGLLGREVCDLFFGSTELPDAHREFRVVRAFNNRLVIEPRAAGSADERQAALDLLQCCFPRLVEFEVRASNQWIHRRAGSLEHDVRANRETLACERGCNPQLAGRSGRVFEIACSGDCEAEASGVGAAGPVIGPANFQAAMESDTAQGRASGPPPARVCLLDEHPKGGLRVGGPASHCIQDSQTSRFGVFRGLEPSRRGMQFSWLTVGGFGSLAIDLLRNADQNRDTSSPRRVEFFPNVNRLVVADGGTLGLEIVNLRDSSASPIFGALSRVY